MSIFKRQSKNNAKGKPGSKAKKDKSLLQTITNTREDDGILDEKALAAIDKRLAENLKHGTELRPLDRTQDDLGSERDEALSKEMEKFSATPEITSEIDSPLGGEHAALAASNLLAQTHEPHTHDNNSAGTLRAKKDMSLSQNEPGNLGDINREKIAKATLEPQNLPGTDLGELRLDIAKITSDIENGEALYRRAQSRVEGLISFAEKAEVNFSLLNRIEPENRRLKARLFSLNKEHENQGHQLSVVKADLEDHKNRLSETTASLNHSNSQLTQALSRIGAYETKFNNVRQEKDALEMQVEREKTSYEVEARENRVLRQKISDVSAALEEVSTDKLSYAKDIESIKIDLEDERTAKGELEKELSDLRISLEKSQTSNNEMKTRVSSVHEEIKTFKTQYEYNVLSRDDKIFALEAKIEDLNKQLSIKDEIVNSASQDLAQLRKARTVNELERERLERTIEGQSYQLHAAEEQLLRSKQNMDVLDKRYKDTAAALAMAHQRRDIQPRAAMPDIRPAMAAAPAMIAPAMPEQHMAAPIEPAPQTAQPVITQTPHTQIAESNITDGVAAMHNTAPNAPKPAGEYDVETDEEQAITNRIMEYKLGQRNKIT